MDLANAYRINSGDGLKAGELAERVLEHMIDEYVSPGDATIDCGAADGRFLARLAGAVGEFGSVLAFEPIPSSYSILADRFAGKRVHILNCCVSDRALDEVKFNYVPSRRWVSSLAPITQTDLPVEEIVVRQTTIDNAVAENRITNPVRFIKMDIEGAEFPALRGGVEVLKRGWPIIVFENGLRTSAARFGYSKDDFFSFFDDLEYELYDIFGTKMTPDLWTELGVKVAWNFIAIRKDDRRYKHFVGAHANTVITALNRS